MNYPLINHQNAVKATYYLLDLDIEAIEERFRQDANGWISNLTHALQLYKSSLQQSLQQSFNSPPLTQNNSFELAESLKHLTHYADSMVAILTPLAKEGLARYLLPTAFTANTHKNIHTIS